MSMTSSSKPQLAPSKQSSSVMAKKAVKKHYDDPEIGAIMNAPNIEQKVKEMLVKCRSLFKNLDREKNL